jgi:elongation factor Ts
MIAHAALRTGPDVEKIKAAHAGNITIEEAIASAIATIGENMTLRRAAALSVEQGAIASYVHAPIAEGLGRIGVLVALESKRDTGELAGFGRKLAMQVAATSPQAIEVSGLDPALIARETAVLADKFRAQGKPANVIDKIVESGLRTFYKEVCLLDQEYIHDPGKTVSQALQEAEKKLGTGIRIAGFVRYGLGEGIEKPA